MLEYTVLRQAETKGSAGNMLALLGSGLSYHCQFLALALC